MTRSKLTVTVSVLAALALLSSSVSAGPPPPVRRKIVLEHTPPGVGVVLDRELSLELDLPPGLYRIYSLKEWKTLVILDRKLTAVERMNDGLTEEVEKLDRLVELRAEETSLLKKSLAEEKAISVRLTEKWEKADAALQKAKAGSFWPWIAIGVAGTLAIIGGTALAVALTKK